MLAVAINLDVDVISVFLSIFMTSLNRPSDSKVMRQIEHINPMCTADFKRIIT